MSTIELIIITGFIVTSIVVIAYLVYTKQYSTLREAAYRLMLRAEKVLQEVDGKGKFAMVASELYSLVPPLLRLIMTQEDVEKILQECYDTAMDWLDDGTVNGSRR